MPRTPKFTVHKQGKQFFVFIPASMSESGEREKRYFRTKTLADEFKKNFKSTAKEHGTKSVQLSAALTLDAMKAQEIMERFKGVTLTQAAQFYAQHHDEAAKCPTMSQAFEESLKRRKDMSQAYLRDMKALNKRLPSTFLAMNIYEVTGRDIATALDHAAGGVTMWRNAFRTLRAILGDQVKSGTIKTNPCKNVHVPKRKRNSEVVIYTPEQVKAVLAACVDYPDGKKRHCADCLAPFAILIFAGVRPTELTRMTWEAVNMTSGNIRLSGEITKTSRTRSIPITDTLRAWLECVPLDHRQGRIIPEDWKSKSQRVKKESGICGRHYQDAARHTYGSFTVVIKDINYVRSAMGHGHTQTFEEHYQNAMDIEKAREYMAILPPSTKIEMEVKTA